jgi:hypothetical protein
VRTLPEASLTKDPRSEAIRAAWTRFLILVTGLASLVLVVAIVLWPWPYDYFVEHFVLPQYEAEFGFRGGRVAVKDSDGDFTVYGFVAVTPDGPLGRAGAKAGDIPVEYHGGMRAFYGALQRARLGEEDRFDVLAREEWPERSKRREIILGPLGGR